MLTVIEFVAFTVFVAILSAYKTRDEKLDTEEGYFVAGHSLPGIVIAGSLMMTNLSAEQLVGTNGQAFSGSMATMAWEATSAFALIILAFVLLPRFLKGNIATIPQFYKMRYDEATKNMFSIMFLFAYVDTMLPTILNSGSVALEKIFGIQELFGISYFAAIAIVCVATGLIGMGYSVFGGLKAVAYSDTINGVGLLIGGFMVPVLGFIALGQLDGGGFLRNRYPGKDECLVRSERNGSVHSVAAAVHRYVCKQHVLLVHQPVYHSAFSGRKEPGRSTEGCYLGWLLQVLGRICNCNPGRHCLSADAGRRSDCRFRCKV